MKISIIIPIFNAENTIKRCLDSIVNQSYHNLEIILVNDGSTDNSQKICDLYKEKDIRIKVINQKNQGVSVARNNGIKIATGEYIQFVDSDDEIKSNMCFDFYSILKDKKPDCIICGMERHFNTYSKEIVNSITMPNRFVEKQEYDNYFLQLYKNNYFNAPVNKLYRLDLIKKYEILFNKDINLGEDLLFNLEYFRHTDKYYILSDENYIIYEETNNSLTRSYNEKKIEYLGVLHLAVDNFCKNFVNYKECEEFNLLYYMRSVYICLEQIITCNIEKNKKRNLVKQIKENEYLLKITKERKTKQIELIYYLFFIKNKYYYITYIGIQFRIFLKKVIRRIRNNEHKNWFK